MPLHCRPASRLAPPPRLPPHAFATAAPPPTPRRRPASLPRRRTVSPRRLPSPLPHHIPPAAQNRHAAGRPTPLRIQPGPREEISRLSSSSPARPGRPLLRRGPATPDSNPRRHHLHSTPRVDPGCHCRCRAPGFPTAGGSGPPLPAPCPCLNCTARSAGDCGMQCSSPRHAARPPP
ncbi:hypothetical protein VPH35_130069 [Triticum aestivum]